MPFKYLKIEILIFFSKISKKSQKLGIFVKAELKIFLNKKNHKIARVAKLKSIFWGGNHQKLPILKFKENS